MHNVPKCSTCPTNALQHEHSMSPHGGSRSVGLLQLPESVLEHICHLIPFRQRVTVLPEVCRELHSFLARGSPLWAEVNAACDFAEPEDRDRFPGLARWLQRRAEGLRHLELSFLISPAVEPVFWDEHDPLEDLWPDMEAALAAAAPHLTFLKLSWSGVVLVGDWILGAQRLETLALMGEDLEFTVPLEGLPRLTTVELGTLGPMGPTAFPEQGWMPAQTQRLTLIPAPRGLIPSQLLQLTALVHLDVSETHFQSGVLEAALPGLTRLTSLALDETNTPVPQELSCLTALRVLSLDRCHMGPPRLLAPDSPLTALRRLACLSISNTPLPAMPVTVAQMTSLQNLYMENARFTRLLPGPYLPCLRILSVDWDVLFCSLPELAAATRLWQLALGRPPNPMLPQEGRASPAAVLATIRAHPSLLEVVLLGNFDGCCDPAMLEVVLWLRGCKPGFHVRAVSRSHYFVEDPLEEGEEGQQEGEGGLQGEGAAGV